MSEKTRLYKTNGDKKKKIFIHRKPGRGLRIRKSKGLPVENILQLQQTLGNRRVQRLIKSGTVQPKLKIGKPNDKYEQQADRMADKVMRMPDKPLAQRQEDEQKEEVRTQLLQRQEGEQEEEKEEGGEGVQPKLIQRQEGEGEEEKEDGGGGVKAKAAPGGALKVTPKVESAIKAMKGGGQPLQDSTRAFFEPRFGADLSQVRVHTDSTAAETAQAINAKAFTTGKDIVFNSGQYSPDTSSGKRLLAHELTHVLQQKGSQKKDSSNVQLIPIPDRCPKTACETSLSFVSTRTSIIVSWERQPGTGRGYGQSWDRVLYYGLKGSSDNDFRRVISMSDRAGSWEVTNLRPNTEYEFLVECTSSRGCERRGRSSWRTSR
jgi:hypothetical protein